MSRPDQATAAEVVALDWREVAPIQGGILRAFEELRQSSFPWLLDSALRDHGLGRFSFAGSDPYALIRVKGHVIEEHCRRAVRVGAQVGHKVGEGDPLACFRTWLQPTPGLADALPLPLPFVGGAVGYLGYELMANSAGESAAFPDDQIDFADATLLMVDRVLAVDHATDRIFALGLGFGSDSTEARQNAGSTLEDLLEQIRPAHAPTAETARMPFLKSASAVEVLKARPPVGLHSETGEVEYTGHIQTIKDEISAGNVYEANLTRRMETPFVGDPWKLYRALRAVSPAPFSCFLEVPDGAIVGSSPERFLKLSDRGEVESRPIKGTRRRGSTPEEDDFLQDDLAASEKDRAENLMICDLVRNDLGRVCRAGSVEVPMLMKVERYASVYQMVSVVTGLLRDDCDGLDLVRAAFPPGSMTGAPKIAAIDLLERLEPVRRGVYSGAIGYFDQRGGMDLSVVIRTILVNKERACLHVGGAVVADSDAASEYAETIDKARALWAALHEASLSDHEEAER